MPIFYVMEPEFYKDVNLRDQLLLFTSRRLVYLVKLRRAMNKVL
jgi:hypothetical protein